MPAERRLAAIMFTDIVGYTALMGRDEAVGRRVQDRHEAVDGRQSLDDEINLRGEAPSEDAPAETAAS